jgi:hyperosmotically inducible periplasmic protein
MDRVSSHGKAIGSFDPVFSGLARRLLSPCGRRSRNGLGAHEVQSFVFVNLTNEGDMKMKLPHRLIGIAVTTLAIVFAAGCDRKTSTESTGDRADGTAERAGEKMDRAATDMSREADKAGDKMSDAAITAKVKTAIIAEPGLKAMQIDVDTVNGVVTLTGTVDAPQLIDQARQVAQSVEGVKSVNNRLTVKVSSDLRRVKHA